MLLSVFSEAAALRLPFPSTEPYESSALWHKQPRHEGQSKDSARFEEFDLLTLHPARARAGELLLRLQPELVQRETVLNPMHAEVKQLPSQLTLLGISKEV